MSQHIAFPFAVSAAGRTAEASTHDHIRQLIQQILFTSPGERVNRPTFGCELRRLLFAPGRDELTAAIEAMVQGAITQWAGHLIQLQGVDIRIEAELVTVNVRYIENETGEAKTASFLT